MKQYKMKNRYEQVQCISQEEMESRIEKLRRLMDEKEVDFLIVLDGTWEGYSHWITGSRVVETIFVFHEGNTIAIYEPDTGIPREDTKYEHICYQSTWRPEDIPDSIRRKQEIRIGLVQPEALTCKMDCMWKSLFSIVTYCDCTQPVDVMKAIKSEEELKWIAQTNKIHEQIFYALPSIIRPGKTIREINCETRYLGEQLGGGGEKSLYYAMQYGRDNGEPLTYALGLSADPDYRISSGDRIFMMVEGNACGGLYTALGRNFILGEPCRQTVEYMEMVLKAQDFAAARMKPGIKLKDIFDTTYQFIEEEGYLTNMQNYLHSFGYVFGERPYLHDRSEVEPLCLGMHYIVHPHIRINRGANTGKVPYDDYFNVDTYYITESGGVRANQYPRKPVIL